MAVTLADLALVQPILIKYYNKSIMGEYEFLGRLMSLEHQINQEPYIEDNYDEDENLY